jgi:hypothetical protein
VVNVNMNAGGPKVQGAQQVRQGVQILPPKAGTRTFTTGGLPNQGAKPGVVIMPPKEQRAVGAASATQLTADELLLLRHLADEYLGKLRAAAGEAQVDEATSNNIKLADGAVARIDTMMGEITAAAAAAAAATAAAAAAATAAAARPVPRAVAGGRTPQNASVTPRRVARPAGPPPPPVVVKMDGGQAVPQATDLPIEGDASQG